MGATVTVVRCARRRYTLEYVLPLAPPALSARPGGEASGIASENGPAIPGGGNGTPNCSIRPARGEDSALLARLPRAPIGP